MSLERRQGFCCVAPPLWFDFSLSDFGKCFQAMLILPEICLLSWIIIFGAYSAWLREGQVHYLLCLEAMCLQKYLLARSLGSLSKPRNENIKTSKHGLSSRYCMWISWRILQVAYLILIFRGLPWLSPVGAFHSMDSWSAQAHQSIIPMNRAFFKGLFFHKDFQAFWTLKIKRKAVNSIHYFRKPFIQVKKA